MENFINSIVLDAKWLFCNDIIRMNGIVTAVEDFEDKVIIVVDDINEVLISKSWSICDDDLGFCFENDGNEVLYAEKIGV